MCLLLMTQQFQSFERVRSEKNLRNIGLYILSNHLIKGYCFIMLGEIKVLYYTGLSIIAKTHRVITMTIKALFIFFIFSITSIFSTSSAENTKDNFGKGEIYVGLQGGWGKAFSLGIAGNGDGRNVEYAAILPQLGVGLSDVVADNTWYRGNLDAVFQGEFLVGYQPNSGYSAGLSILLRYNFLASKQWVPYVEIGGGFGVLEFDLKDQADGLIFYPQAGLGIHYFAADNLSLDLGWRFHHMSNADSELPNNSINSSLVLVGFSWFFD